MQLKNTIDTNMFPQSIGLEEIVNARELGGYVGADGRKVKRGVLLRTGALSEISEADRRRLLEHPPPDRRSMQDNMAIPLYLSIKIHFPRS